MAAAGPAPRGFSLTGARPFQYGAAANNTSGSTQRKQHWRLTALAPAAPQLAARAADARRGGRPPARPHGKCSLCAGRRRETTSAAMHCGGGRRGAEAAAAAVPVPVPARLGSAPPLLPGSAGPGCWRPARLAGSVRFFCRNPLAAPCPPPPPLCQAEFGRAAPGPSEGPRRPRAGLAKRRGKHLRILDQASCFCLLVRYFKCSQLVMVHKKRKK